MYIITTSITAIALAGFFYQMCYKCVHTTIHNKFDDYSDAESDDAYTSDDDNTINNKFDNKNNKFD
jgi:hypothetical protein